MLFDCRACFIRDIRSMFAALAQAEVSHAKDANQGGQQGLGRQQGAVGGRCHPHQMAGERFHGLEWKAPPGVSGNGKEIRCCHQIRLGAHV